jgi:hypothetical protein
LVKANVASPDTSSRLHAMLPSLLLVLLVSVSDDALVLVTLVSA